MRNALVLLGFLVAVATAFAYPNNPPLGYAGQPPSGANCVSCHSSYPLNSGNGSLQIAGLPTGGYQPGNTYTVTVTLADPGQTRWGFECTSVYLSGGNYLQAGNFTVTDPTHTSLGLGTGTAPDYMRQTTAGCYSGTSGPTSWSFSWTAPNPAVGAIGFYASGAACNNTGGTGGDYCYTTSTTINPGGTTPAVDITLAPVNPPIVIPATGGSFNFNATIANTGGSPATFDVWIMMQLPSGSWYGPALGPVNLNVPGGASITRLRTQAIAASAPSGTYLYQGYVGTYASGTKWDSSGFNFSKSALGSDGPTVSEFRNYGEEFSSVQNSTLDLPAGFVLLGAYPNPFNPSTRISFALPQATAVRLAVYDLHGREVALLTQGWREAGSYEATFDGAALVSGVYLYRLQAGNVSAVGKIMLLK